MERGTVFQFAVLLTIRRAYSVVKRAHGELCMVGGGRIASKNFFSNPYKYRNRLQRIVHPPINIPLLIVEVHADLEHLFAATRPRVSVLFGVDLRQHLFLLGKYSYIYVVYVVVGEDGFWG